MVKKIFWGGLACCVGMASILAGCNKSSSPVVPVNAAVLNLVIPPQILNTLSNVKSQAVPVTPSSSGGVPNPSAGALEYYLATAGETPVTGVITFTSGSDVGNIFINLPKAGVWVVSAEWFQLNSLTTAGVKKAVSAKLTVPGYSSASPEFVGADEVNVQGTTSFTLSMEDIGYDEDSCYTTTITDNTDCEVTLGFGDLYSFNSGVTSDSTSLGTGDVQALFDQTTLSTYLAGPVSQDVAISPAPSIFTYLGNGDLVDFPLIPSNAVYYPNTLQAKTAAVGSAAATLAANDIFAVKVLSTNATAWVQFTPENNCGITLPGSTQLYFWFVYNNQGLNYMKFDQTTYGATYCNQNNPTPTPPP